MSDAAMWREKATALRERARDMEDREQAEILLTLAEDCDQLAADLETAGASEEKKAGRTARCIAVSGSP
jgi:hypothetical protein